MTRDEIGERVAQALVQALGVSRNDIRPETSLAGDLEAESIDFLDVVFRLEKDFGIEIARGELFPPELLRDPALVSNGPLTEDMLTVKLIVDYVDHKLRAAHPA
jgi:acyl carrier protein